MRNVFIAVVGNLRLLYTLRMAQNVPHAEFIFLDCISLVPLEKLNWKYRHPVCRKIVLLYFLMDITLKKIVEQSRMMVELYNDDIDGNVIKYLHYNYS